MTRLKLLVAVPNLFEVARLTPTDIAIHRCCFAGLESYNSAAVRSGELRIFFCRLRAKGKEEQDDELYQLHLMPTASQTFR